MKPLGLATFALLLFACKHDAQATVSPEQAEAEAQGEERAGFEEAFREVIGDWVTLTVRRG